MNAGSIPIDYNLDAAPGEEWRGRGVWIVSSHGSLTWQSLSEDALRKQSILVKAGGRVFVNEDGGAKSKAGKGFVVLEVGVNCTAEELAALEEWREQAAQGQRPLPVTTERLPRLVLERRVGAAKRDVARLEMVPPPDTEEAARLFVTKVKRAKTRLTVLETTIEARGGKPKRAVQGEKSP